MSMDAKLDIEIEERFDELNKMKGDTKEYVSANDALLKMIDRKIEIRKLEITEAQNEKQMKKERVDRVIDTVIEVGRIVVPAGLTFALALTSLEFEKDDSFSSTLGKSIFKIAIKK